MLVTTVTGWVIVPSDNDNYVKLGQTDKLVDGSDPEVPASGIRLCRSGVVGGLLQPRARQTTWETAA